MAVKKGYKQTEVGVIPEDWDVKCLGELSVIRMCRRILAEQTHATGDVPFFKIGTFGGIPDAFIPAGLYEEYRRKYSFPSRGDILLSAAGTLGRAIVYDGRDAYFQDSNIVWLDIDKRVICNEFLYYCYQRIQWAPSEGSTISRLYNGIIRATRIWVPDSVEEQLAIAGALSDADAWIESLEQLIAKKRLIKQGAMQELLTGKRRLPGFSGEWETTTLGLNCAFENGDRSSNYPSLSSFRRSGIPFINAGHLSNGRISLSQMDYITEQAYERLGGGKVRVGDILFCLRGSLGKFGVVGDGFGEAAIASSLVIIRADSKNLDSGFLRSYFNSSRCTQMIELLSGGAAQPNLGVRDLTRFEIPIPPSVREQTAIAAVLSDMDAEIEALQVQLAKAREIKQGMMQELLTGRIRLVS